VDVPLNILFPESSGAVVATWYSGRLVIPRGKQIEYVHMDYLSRYERYTIIDIKEGVVVSSEDVKELPIPKSEVPSAED